MNKFDSVLLIAGVGSRLSSDIRKGRYELLGSPLFTYALDIVLEHEEAGMIILVVHPDDYEEIHQYLHNNHYPLDKIILVKGGKSRAESVRNALVKIKSARFIIHDGARPLLTNEDLTRIISSLNEFDASTFASPIYDTIKEVSKIGIKTLKRDNLKAISTPQAFHQYLIPIILNPKLPDEEILDEIMLVEDQYRIGFVEERHSHRKLTSTYDLAEIEFNLQVGSKSLSALKKANSIGQSFDFHPFVKNRKLVLGGIVINYDQGLAGHSDADVVYHVVAESLMGALNLGDLGTLFPDQDPQYKNKDSAYFIKEVMKYYKRQKAKILSLDIMVYLEKPSLAPYKKQMAINIASLLEIDRSCVNIKATTMEKRGLVGQGDGVASEAMVLITKASS